jgi:hypothetical protein
MMNPELVALAVSTALALAGYWLVPRKLVRGASRAFLTLARRRRLAVIMVFFAGILAGAALTAHWGVPPPLAADEFSYLLAADTFAHGRLTNPTHLMWVHLETLHVIQQPTYASKYPPGQGLVLALGQAAFGQPVVGAWLSTALACAAICWMLQGWVPPRWAFLGGLLAVLHFALPGRLVSEQFSGPAYWNQSYWGGAVAATGGALVYGAVRRLCRQPRVRDSLWLGLGLIVLANSRPFEGLVISIPAMVLLGVVSLGSNGPSWRRTLTHVVLPFSTMLAVGALAMSYYNYRVTQDPLELPYQVHEDTYAVASGFLWEPTKPAPLYRHRSLREFHVVWQLGAYLAHGSLHDPLEPAKYKLGIYWRYYLGWILTVPLLSLPWTLRDFWTRFALHVCLGFFVVLTLLLVANPHYAAPITALLILLVIQSMRLLWLSRGAVGALGRIVVCTVWLWSIAAVVVTVCFLPWPEGDGFHMQRARMLADLEQQGGTHLVIVHYEPTHNPHHEWVYNRADIDQAAVVWARDMGPSKNRELLDYFTDRRVWLLEADQTPPDLRLYPLRPTESWGQPRNAR